MKITIRKFGFVLTSRDGGKKAFSTFLPKLDHLKKDEIISVDFNGVGALSPGWADEFITPLINTYPERVVLSNTKNISVKVTIDFLVHIKNISGEKFKIEN